MADIKVNASGGIGFGGSLFIVFLVLKLCGVIDWSWWWVTCPLWAGLAFLLAFLLVVGAFAFVAWCIAMIFGP